MIKEIDFAERTSMYNYQFFLPTRVQYFKSSEHKTSYHVQSLGAWCDPRGGDLTTAPLYDVTHVLHLSSSLM